MPPHTAESGLRPLDVPPGPLARGARPLALAVTLLLFAQWPLRDVVGAGAVPYASARGAHLAAPPEHALRSRARQ